ncbi:MAG: N-formylglutamate amidohydrolase [Rhizobiaceae bacterium]|nr:N-formylglutamate amidohydrolase [Rhizobiaceae bacterium]
MHSPAEQRVPFVFNSPHSGRQYPISLLKASNLSALDIRRSEDVFVDQLFAGVVGLGAPLLAAEFPRAWLDVNREPYELDPKLFNESLPAHANCRSIRVAGGLGTIPRLVAENVQIYRKRPSLPEAMWRIENVYRPYHETLRGLMAKSSVMFGYAVLVDCHSMPSSGARNEGQSRPDIIVGDRYGTSCNGDISRSIMRQFADRGYSVARNKPYAGGFITEHYGRPLKGLHAVQIEINRGLYVNEKTLEPTAGFSALAQDITAVVSQAMSLPDSGFYSQSMAAE